MGLFKKTINSFFYGILFLIVLIIGNYLLPGKLLDSAFSPVGIIIIVATVFLDAFFNQTSID